jgi:hypothetical protein
VHGPSRCAKTGPDRDWRGREGGGVESGPMNNEIEYNTKSSTLCDALQRLMDGLVDEVELKCDFIM